MTRSLRTFGIVLGALAASACSHLPEMPNMSVLTGAGADAPQATPNLEPRERVRVAIERLGAGDERGAEVELRAALEQQPSNTTAQRLLEQIETDPQALLGERGSPYVVRQGETMSELSQRFLGDPLLFYALARYNNLSAPNQVVAGQSLVLPRRARVAAASASAPASSQTPSASAPSGSVSARDAERANGLRLQALQQLNAGRVNDAVRLLRQARSIDGENAAIQRDLDRAERLQASLGSARGGAN